MKRQPKDALKLDGWLLLVPVFLVASIIRLGLSLLSGAFTVFFTGTWSRLTDSASPAYDPLWQPVLVAELTTHLFFLIGGIYLLRGFWQRRPAFPRQAIVLITANLLVVCVDFFVTNEISDVASNSDSASWRELFFSILWSVISILFLVRSKRVKTVFANPSPSVTSSSELVIASRMDTQLSSSSAVPREFDAQHDQMEINLHLAEYNALTNRNTYWMTLQYAVWPILLVYYTFIANVWSTLSHELLIWVSGIVTQVAIMHLYEAGYEIYNNVAYIEKQLRPKVERLLPHRQIWGYEPYLKNQRGNSPIWYEYGPTLGIAAALLIAVVLKLGSWSMWDYIGLIFNTLSLIAVVLRTSRLIGTRRHMNRDLLSL